MNYNDKIQQAHDDIKELEAMERTNETQIAILCLRRLIEYYFNMRSK